MFSMIFGSVKKNKPDAYVSNEVEGFNIVSTGLPSNPPGPDMRYMPPREGPGYPLYPTLQLSDSSSPYLAICPQAPPGYQPPSVHPPSVHPLDSLPFKLASHATPTIMSANYKTSHELEVIRNSLNQLNKRISSQEYSYSFELERSIVREECLSNC